MPGEPPDLAVEMAVRATPAVSLEDDLGLTTMGIVTRGGLRAGIETKDLCPKALAKAFATCAREQDTSPEDVPCILETR